LHRYVTSIEIIIGPLSPTKFVSILTSMTIYVTIYTNNTL